MNRVSLILLLIGLTTYVANAQKPSTKSPKKLVKEAQEYEKVGDYYRAAVYYETAYTMTEEKKPVPEYIYNAGRCYFEIRDYANAAKSLEKVKDKNEIYDQPGYKYALALKQNGQHDKAKTAFNDFITTYSGSDKLAMKERVDTEIKGCNFALKAKDHTDGSVSVQHLDPNINTDKTEFAPIPFNNNVLYFSSTVSGVASIYRTQKVNDKWVPRQSPSLFLGKMEKPHFGNGSFTPDGKRFYFTQCDLEEGSKPKCAIYIMSETEGKWSNPVRLPDYINAEGANTTHPCVVVEGDKEILYFASDREGGKGGLDLWYCTRTLNSRGNNFTLPKNLGRNINTTGDEITPFYHVPTENLYFSSNGRISAGGLDVFRSKGARLKWEVAQNQGFPVNSEADDLYYTVSEAHGGGYLVSNRRADPNKVATTNDDVFYFGQERIVVSIAGTISGCEDDGGTPLEDVSVKLFEVVDGVDELVTQRMLTVGEYKFELEANKNYLVEISKPASDYKAATFEISTFDFKHSEDVTKDVCLKIPEEPKPTALTLKDMLNRIVPVEYDSPENPYVLPMDPPIDPETGEPYAEGTAMYDAFVQVNEKAEQANDRKVYYNDLAKENVVPYFEDVVWNEPDKDPVDNTSTSENTSSGEFPWFKNWTEEPKAYEEEPVIRYKVQVSAVRYYKENRYEDLFDINGVKMAFETIDGDITRVLIVPKDNDDAGVSGFKSKGDALDALIHIRDMTDFDRAFVSRYEDEVRVGDGFRGWDENEGTN